MENKKQNKKYNKTERDSDTENKLIVIRGKRGGKNHKINEKD